MKWKRSRRIEGDYYEFCVLDSTLRAIIGAEIFRQKGKEYCSMHWWFGGWDFKGIFSTVQEAKNHFASVADNWKKAINEGLR